MGENSSKAAASSAGFSRRRSNFTFRDPKIDNGSNQICNRLGCSTRYNSNKGTEISNADKLKTSRTMFLSSNKALTGSSSKSSSSANLRKKKEHRISAPVQGMVVAESSRRCSLTDESESSSGCEEVDSGSVCRMTGKQIVHRESEDIATEILDGSSSEASGTSGGSSANTQLKTRKEIRPRSASSRLDVSSSPLRRAIAAQNSTQAIKSSRVAQRRVPKNLISTPTPDAPSSSSSADSTSSKRIETLRKRYPDGDPSTSTGRGRIGSSIGGSLGSSRSKAVANPSIFERLLSQPTSRGNRNQHMSRIDASSARTQRNTIGENRLRLSEQGEDSMFPLVEPLMVTQEPQRRSPVGETSISRPPCLSRRDAITRPASSNNGTSRGRQVSRLEDSSAHMYHTSLSDRHSSQHLNIEGIAEVLLALERIEHEDLTYEQLVSLETNFILNGLGFYDQHRDMRLDIDNMSYEELLALGEKMGTVSTALSEEQLSRCLKRSIYQPACTSSKRANYTENDVKCSICQEEYAMKDEVGKLVCDHMYHVECIQQWLRQKNWCPICKASVCSSS